MRFGVWGLGFGIWGLGSGVWGFGFRVWGFGCGFWGLGCGGLGFGVHGSWLVVRGLGMRGFAFLSLLFCFLPRGNLSALWFRFEGVGFIVFKGWEHVLAARALAKTVFGTLLVRRCFESSAQNWVYGLWFMVYSLWFIVYGL